MIFHLVVACGISAYGATAIIVGTRYWRSLAQRDINRAVDLAQMQVAPGVDRLAPLVAVLVRPAWAAFHGLLWPLLILRDLTSRP